jgi:hypothetical protein
VRRGRGGCGGGCNRHLSLTHWTHVAMTKSIFSCYEKGPYNYEKERDSYWKRANKKRKRGWPAGLRCRSACPANALPVGLQSKSHAHVCPSPTLCEGFLHPPKRGIRYLEVGNEPIIVIVVVVVVVVVIVFVGVIVIFIVM